MHRINREQREKRNELDRMHLASTTVRVDGKWHVVQVCGVNKKRNFRQLKCNAEDITNSEEV